MRLSETVLSKASFCHNYYNSISICERHCCASSWRHATVFYSEQIIQSCIQRISSKHPIHLRIQQLLCVDCLL